MILPIVAYGAPILKKPCADIDPSYPDLRNLITNMWDTLHNANGCGLAAPQVNAPIRLFIIDSKPTYESMTDEARAIYFDEDSGIKEVFINPKLIAQSNERLWQDEEGCLSIPGITGMVKRPWQVTILYQDENFQERYANFSGLTARMIQHEYDHIEGRLYLDYLSPLKKRLVQTKLENIKKDKIVCKYPLSFYK